jgi:hypothetical protein
VWVACVALQVRVELEVGESGLRYTPGDALGICPSNRPQVSALQGGVSACIPCGDRAHIPGKDGILGKGCIGTGCAAVAGEPPAVCGTCARWRSQ